MASLDSCLLSHSTALHCRVRTTPLPNNSSGSSLIRVRWGEPYHTCLQVVQPLCLQELHGVPFGGSQLWDVQIQGLLLHQGAPLPHQVLCLEALKTIDILFNITSHNTGQKNYNYISSRNHSVWHSAWNTLNWHVKWSVAGYYGIVRLRQQNEHLRNKMYRMLLTNSFK